MPILHENASSQTARIIRVVVFGFWVIKIAFDPLLSLTLMLASLYEPVGFLKVLPSSVQLALLSPAWLMGIKAAAVIGSAAAALNRGGRALAILACVLITLYQGILHSFAGHVNHEAIIFLYAAYVLAACAKAPHVTVVGILAVACWTYSFVGLCRVLRGGLEVFTSGSISFWAMKNSYRFVHPTWDLGRLLLDQPWISVALNAGFPVITLFEALAPFALISRRFRKAFLGAMIPFHLLSWMFLELFFWKNLLACMLLLDVKAAKGRVE